MSVDNERRSGGQRVPIKTLVEIGAGAGGSAAFEAESVDITTAGMHLKTAYLPETGEPLICRLEGNGKEIVVQGEVVWRNEDAYGGDFGVRFLDVDEDSLSTLRELLGEQPAGEASADSQGEHEAPRAARNTRVRLHIEGLGSPMKARVREVTRSEVLVGSNLEFLKVGRSVDLENLDCAENRPARIERVNIEIDPTSHVPQLMVALRYLDAQADMPGDERAEAASYRTRGQEDDMSEEGDARGESDDAQDDDLDDMRPQGRSAMLWSRVKEVGPKLAVFGGKAKELGGRAKDVVSRAIDKARAKSGAGDELQPRMRRTTAPPPNGGLRGDGSRITRESIEAALDEIPAPKKKLAKRAAIIGVAVLMIAIVAVAFTRKPKADATATADPAAEAASAGEGVAADDPSGTPAAAAPGGGAMVANVPLFGPTPMAAGTEAAPTPTPTPNAAAAVAAFPAAVAVPPPGDAKPAGDEEATDDTADDEGSGSAAVAANAAGGDDEEADDTDDGASAKPAARPAPHRKHANASQGASGGKASAGSFGRGKVRNPTVLALRMNRDIKSIRGTGNANGFTVEIGGTRSKEAAAGLARQDRRIAGARVTNKGSSADLVVNFREPVPGYRVVAQGNTLRILIGNEKKTAEAKQTTPRGHKAGSAAPKKKQGKKSSGNH